MRIIQRERSFASADHRVDIARVGGQPRKVAIKVGSAQRRDKIGLIGLGKSGRRKEERGENPGKRLSHIPPLAHAMANGKSSGPKSAPGRSGWPTTRFMT